MFRWKHESSARIHWKLKSFNYIIDAEQNLAGFMPHESMHIFIQKFYDQFSSFSIPQFLKDLELKSLFCYELENLSAIITSLTRSTNKLTRYT